MIARRSALRFGLGALAAAGALSVTGCAQRGTIGAVLAQRDDGRVLVRDAPAGLAAEEAGLRSGDEILLVEGYDVRLLDARRLNEVLTGRVGEPVRLTVLRGDRALQVTVRRSPAGQSVTAAPPKGR